MEVKVVVVVVGRCCWLPPTLYRPANALYRSTLPITIVHQKWHKKFRVKCYLLVPPPLTPSWCDVLWGEQKYPIKSGQTNSVGLEIVLYSTDKFICKTRTTKIPENVEE